MPLSSLLPRETLRVFGKDVRNAQDSNVIISQFSLNRQHNCWINIETGRYYTRLLIGWIGLAA